MIGDEYPHERYHQQNFFNSMQFVPLHAVIWYLFKKINKSRYLFIHFELLPIEKAHDNTISNQICLIRNEGALQLEARKTDKEISIYESLTLICKRFNMRLKSFFNLGCCSA